MIPAPKGRNHSVLRKAVWLAAAGGGSRRTWRILLPALQFGSNIMKNPLFLLETAGFLHLDRNFLFSENSLAYSEIFTKDLRDNW